MEEEYLLTFNLNKVRPVRQDINEALSEVWGAAAGDSNVQHWKHNGESWELTLRLHSDDETLVREFKQKLQARLGPIAIDNTTRCELCGEKELCEKCGGEV